MQPISQQPTIHPSYLRLRPDYRAGTFLPYLLDNLHLGNHLHPGATLLLLSSNPHEPLSSHPSIPFRLEKVRV